MATEVPRHPVEGIAGDAQPGLCLAHGAGLVSTRLAEGGGDERALMPVEPEGSPLALDSFYPARAAGGRSNAAEGPTGRPTTGRRAPGGERAELFGVPV
jgi:hypothetical protein